jgi:hypothetical protein
MNRIAEARTSTTTSASRIMADLALARDRPDPTGYLIHTANILKSHLKPHRVNDNHRPERCRSNRTTRGIHGKTAKRIPNTATEKEKTGMTMVTRMTMRLHREDNLTHITNTRSTGNGRM